MREVLVVATGSANTASVISALARCGASPRLSSSASELDAADHVVLPGVGAFGAVAGRLERLGLLDVLRRRIAAERATLAICLGMQLLGAGSEESPGAAGLGVVPAVARRFAGDVRVPQLGWNRVDADSSCRVLASGFAYFANSYCLVDAPAGWRWARTEHGVGFVSAMERGGVVACQFHPELSGEFGADLIKRWLRGDAR